jgi:hypothetical protein
MPIELFGFSLGRSNKKSAEEKKAELKSFVRPDSEDGAVVLDYGAGGGYFGTYMDFNSEIKGDAESVAKYREMSLHPEVESAIEDVCNESIVYADFGKAVDLILDKTSMSDSIKEKVQKEFEGIYQMLDFNSKGYEIFRRWYIDGRLYFHKVVDPKNPKLGVQDLRYVDPMRMKKVVELKTDQEKGQDHTQETPIIKKAEEYFVYRENDNDGTGLKIAPEAVAYCASGLYDASNKRVISYLHKAIKPLNQLRMIEDAVVIYRISRAPERRIFYIDVGNLPKNKSEQYVRSIMNKFRNKLVYDATSGEIRDDKRHMNMLEDFYLPRREGGKGTEIDTLSGGENLGEIEDVEYFQRKLYQSLSVPMGRLDFENEYGMGRASEIQRDELKFMKLIDRLRSKFSGLFLDILRTQCILKGIMTEDEWDKDQINIKFDFARDNHFAELKEQELTSERLNLLRDMSDHIGKYYSVEYIRKSVLRQTDEDIKKIDAQIADEREKGIITDDSGGRGRY